MRVIKATDLLARRARAPEIRVPVLAAVAPVPPPVDAARRELERQVEALSQQVATLTDDKAALAETLEVRDADLGRMERELEAAVAEAEASGRAAGLAEGAEAKAESLEILEGTAGKAMDQLRGDLRGMETLAVALAKAALAKVFGDDRDMAARVARLVRRQLEGLDRAAVLRIEVSAADFGDVAALGDLSLAAGLEGIEIKALDLLPPGDCRIRLRLGELEVGLGQQWSRLSGLLDETLAMEEGA